MASRGRRAKIQSSVETKDNVDSEENSRENAEQRRNLRSQYRKLIQDLQGKEIEDEDGTITNESTMDQTAEKLKEHLELADDLHKKVKHTREAALDSHLYRLIASNAKHKVQNLQSNLFSFSPVEFAEKLKSFLDVDRAEYPNSLPDQAWIDLGLSCSNSFKTAPTFHFISGTFDPGEVHPTQRKPRASQVVNGDKQKPTIVQQIPLNDKNYEEKTTEEVENVLKTLRTLYRRNDNNPICYFQFVINPNSFARTVENIFHTSFLIKDGEATMFYDDYELPVIMPSEKKDGSNGGDERCALAMGISVSEWKDLKVALKITKSAIIRKSDKK